MGNDQFRAGGNIPKLVTPAGPSPLEVLFAQITAVGQLAFQANLKLDKLAEKLGVEFAPKEDKPPDAK